MKNLTVEKAIEYLRSNGYIIGILWSFEDILQVAEDNFDDVTLTTDQLFSIRDRIENNHDANEGINWTVIEEAIREEIYG